MVRCQIAPRMSGLFPLGKFFSDAVLRIHLDEADSILAAQIVFVNLFYARLADKVTGDIVLGASPSLVFLVELPHISKQMGGDGFEGVETLEFYLDPQGPVVSEAFFDDGYGAEVYVPFQRDRAPLAVQPDIRVTGSPLQSGHGPCVDLACRANQENSVGMSIAGENFSVAVEDETARSFDALLVNVVFIRLLGIVLPKW